MERKIEKIGFGLSATSILGSIYAYTLDEHLGLFIMLGSKTLQDWNN